jgi:alanyl-tRNA synthetase
VGDVNHLTFFEMLGNFSIGDYFKKEAIIWGWEFLTQELQLPPETLWVTIYETDDEAHEMWLKDVGVPEDRIYRYPDNWWGPAGSEGPCGPCSEIHYDFGQSYGCSSMSNDNSGTNLTECGPGCSNCNRFCEIWNLVFMQYYADQNGNLTPLPKPNIDTGMGLERITSILQGKDNVFDTDLFQPLIKEIASNSGHSYGSNPEHDRSFRVVAEHTRAVSFLIADGVTPSNEGRGYVLRRILRRAVRFSMKLGLPDFFEQQLALTVIEVMSPQYPELELHRAAISNTIQLEEQRFRDTSGRAVKILDGMLFYRALHTLTPQSKTPPPPSDAESSLEQIGASLALETLRATESNEEAVATWANMLSGRELFVLHDTYGLSPELAQEIAAEHNVSADMENFSIHMKQQRQKTKTAETFDIDIDRANKYEPYIGKIISQFMGYDNLQGSGTVLGLLADGKEAHKASVGTKVEVILDHTTFYPEGGGQAGDTGFLKNPTATISIHDTNRPIGDLIVHYGEIISGTIEIGSEVITEVEPGTRYAAACNHTATHLLHAALRQILGTHIRQAGSLVTTERLRFDYTANTAPSDLDLSQIEELVNQKIRENLTVNKHETSYGAAIEEGALAFFGDRYGDRVRVVEIANDTKFSIEVCGGTHLSLTGAIGNLIITNDTNIGSGLRRIEAVTGTVATKLIRSTLATQSATAKVLNSTTSEIETRASTVMAEIVKLQNELANLSIVVARQSVEGYQDQVRIVSGINVLSLRAQANSMDALRSTGDWLRDKLTSGVITIGSVIEGIPTIIVMVTSDLVAQGINANTIIKHAAPIIGGGGGGRPNLAQAGGRDSGKLDEAIQSIAPYLDSIISDNS